MGIENRAQRVIETIASLTKVGLQTYAIHATGKYGAVVIGLEEALDKRDKINGWEVLIDARRRTKNIKGAT